MCRLWSGCGFHLMQSAVGSGGSGRGFLPGEMSSVLLDWEVGREKVEKQVYYDDGKCPSLRGFGTRDRRGVAGGRFRG